MTFTTDYAMSELLIITVGTGTAGKHSNLAQGLINTVAKAAPRLFWLVPSTHPDSIGAAQLIREGSATKAVFQAWAPDAPFRCIQSPDDIFDCRAALREVISAARKSLRPGEKLQLNPTSGTKQMSAGATLAALDEGIGDIVFTVGERSDGVVMTGTERFAAFSTEGFFLERDLRIADDLFRNGAFKAAASVLKPYPHANAVRARDTALCLHEWHRMNYGAAANHAARLSEGFRVHLRKLAESGDCSPFVLADMLFGADELLKWGDAEEALGRYYRCAELTAKVRLAMEHDLHPRQGGYAPADVFSKLPMSLKLKAELPERSGVLHLGSDIAWRVLRDLADPIAEAFFGDRVLRHGLSQRNESVYGHGKEPCDLARVREVGKRLRRLIETHIPTAFNLGLDSTRPGSLRNE